MGAHHSYLLGSILFLCCTATINAERTDRNDTTVIPDKLTNHGDSNLVCKPAKFPDILLFVVGNYIAHAATTRVEPWEGTGDYGLAALRALLLPGSGIFRGLQAIFSRARFARTDIETAARAAALCTLVRTKDFHRASGSLIYLDGLNNPRWPTPTLHGSYKVPLPDKYTLIVLPRDAEFQETPPDSKSSICCNYNAAKILVALGQSIFSCVTLYRTRGDQINEFGYVAFGLTVAPYAFMSVINLLGNLLCPEYPTLYLVESDALVEARQAQEAEAAIAEEGEALLQEGREAKNARRQSCWHFEGAVGRLTVDYQRQMLESHRLSHDILVTLPVALFLSAVPIAIIGIISGFQKGNSTHAQRAWVMTWVVLGSAVGSFSYWLTILMPAIVHPQGLSTTGNHVITGLLWTLLYSAPAIGGFVVVIQMISAYGICFRIT